MASKLIACTSRDHIEWHVAAEQERWTGGVHLSVTGEVNDGRFSQVRENVIIVGRRLRGGAAKNP